MWYTLNINHLGMVYLHFYHPFFVFWFYVISDLVYGWVYHLSFSGWNHSRPPESLVTWSRGCAVHASSGSHQDTGPCCVRWELLNDRTWLMIVVGYTEIPYILVGAIYRESIIYKRYTHIYIYIHIYIYSRIYFGKPISIVEWQRVLNNDHVGRPQSWTPFPQDNDL